MRTLKYIPAPSGAKLVVLEDMQPRCIALDARAEWTFGRKTPENSPDIAMNSTIVSREHGIFANVNDVWFFSCNPQAINPTYINGEIINHGQYHTRNPVPLKSGDVIRIDTSDLNRPDRRGVMLLFTTGTISGRWSIQPLDKKEIYIGRDQNRCDIVLPMPYVSAVHAKIEKKRGRYYISDCTSHSGTWLNNQKVEKPLPIREKDRIGICDFSIIVLGGALLYEQRDASYDLHTPRDIPYEQKPILLRADIDTRKVKDNSGHGIKELIRDIHLEIREATLVAMLGTAGAGKSTVMNCLNGMDTQGVVGRISFMDQDLIHDFDRLKCLIGSVPQKKTFHDSYTPEQEFWDAAKLRLPGDTSKEEIQRRVDETIRLLRMENVRHSKNSKLSGGEQTRVNVGIELVADRTLLCLDEPDQGLSPNLKHELVEILRKLAHESNKCILTIIHDVSEIDMFDQVIMLVKADNVGQLAFSGTPAQAKEYFGVEIQAAYALLENAPQKYVEEWKNESRP